jgi:spore coat protein H
MLRIPQYVQAISVKVEYVAAIVNEQKTKEMLKKYHDIVSPFVLNHPDSKALPGGIAAFEFEYRRIAQQIEINHQIFYLEQEKPMPYFLAPPEPNDEGIRFYWDASFDLQGDPLTYVFQLSKEPGFGKIIEEKKLDNPEYIMKTLAPGTYYFRVITYDSKGNSQVGFDEYVDARKNLYFGVRQFKIE